MTQLRNFCCSALYKGLSFLFINIFTEYAFLAVTFLYFNRYFMYTKLRIIKYKGWADFIYNIGLAIGPGTFFIYYFFNSR